MFSKLAFIQPPHKTFGSSGAVTELSDDEMTACTGEKSWTADMMCYRTAVISK